MTFAPFPSVQVSVQAKPYWAHDSAQEPAFPNVFKIAPGAATPASAADDAASSEGAASEEDAAGWADGGALSAALHPHRARPTSGNQGLRLQTGALIALPPSRCGSR